MILNYKGYNNICMDFDLRFALWWKKLFSKKLQLNFCQKLYFSSGNRKNSAYDGNSVFKQ